MFLGHQRMVIPQTETGATEGWRISALPWRRWSHTTGITKLVIYPSLLLLVILLFCYFPCDLTLSASNYYVHCDWTAHTVIYCIVSNLPFLAYGRTYFTMICPKCKNVCKSGVLSFTCHFSIKCNLGYQLCLGYELFLIFWKMAKTKKNNKNKQEQKIYIFD